MRLYAIVLPTAPAAPTIAIVVGEEEAIVESCRWKEDRGVCLLGMGMVLADSLDRVVQ